MYQHSVTAVRKLFIDYFVQNSHVHVPASPLIPHNDPSLMFVNSGMVQFKNVFTGQETRNYVRATTAQKSVRAGGKHNDLDNVGYTARHHTFFEMLGNFSFGDYFKEEAIYYAWQLLTKEFGLDKDKLYVTIYHTDNEADSLWRKIAGLDDRRIIKINTTDNFWSMGDTGPCGPCSEIFYDHGEHIQGGLPGTADQDGDRYIEIWNMVFMQFEQIDKDTRIDLPKKSIDTGMGLERIAAVLQGVHDNYDIDLFRSIIDYTQDLLKVTITTENQSSFRVIADHLRSCAFLIADGVMPANEGRGYVLRRIMRRSMRHLHMLGAKSSIMYRLVPKLVSLMAETYPELKHGEIFISDILHDEEVRFKATLDRGLKLLAEETLSIESGGKLSGDTAFKLYDTYGFPLDLTQDILNARGIIIDTEEFDFKMQQQKALARANWSGSGESKVDQIWFDIRGEFGGTEFVGYTLENVEGSIVAIVKDNQLIDGFDRIGDQFILLTNQTPFYAESGGQIGDIGMIESPDAKIKVTNTAKYLGNLHAHICILETGKIAVGDVVKLSIDSKYRRNIRMHHSATHILHAVLRQLFGEHIVQKGSLVAHNRLRFDISHPKALLKADIDTIEDRVNAIIAQNSNVNTVLMSTEQAISTGAMALFGEKYDSEVRVVSMGYSDQKPYYSIELCGGTHVKHTGEIGSFKIISESAVAAGVRRIEAVCGEFAVAVTRDNENILTQIAETLKTSKSDIVTKLNNLCTDNKRLYKELLEFQVAALIPTKQEIADSSVSVASVRFIYKYTRNIEPKLLRAAAERAVNKGDDLVLVYVDNMEDKISITVAVSKAVSHFVNAGALAKGISLFLGGTGGGGQATLAQAGGTDVTKLSIVKERIVEILQDITN